MYRLRQSAYRIVSNQRKQPFSQLAVDPREFERIWRSNHDSFRKNTVIVIVLALLMGFIRAIVFRGKLTKMLAFLVTLISVYMLIESLICFVTLLELMTEGHTYLVLQMEKDIIAILKEGANASKSGDSTEDVAITTAKKLDKVNAANRRLMVESERLVLFGVYMYGICMLFCSICYMMMGFHAALNIPCANVYIMRLIMSIILSFVVIRSFVKHVQLIAKVGDAYHRMVRDFGSAECFQLSMACFGDPTALRDMYDTNEVFKVRGGVDEQEMRQGNWMRRKKPALKNNLS